MSKSDLLVKPKKKCCRDSPRCKSCAVVCKRLEKKGFAQRLDNGRYLLSVDLTKKQLKLARAR